MISVSICMKWWSVDPKIYWGKHGAKKLFFKFENIYPFETLPEFSVPQDKFLWSSKECVRILSDVLVQGKLNYVWVWAWYFGKVTLIKWCL